MSQLPATPPPPSEFTFPTASYATPVVKRHSILGIVSFVIALAAGVMDFALFAMAGFMQASSPGGMDEHSPQALLIGFGILGLMLVNLAGAGLGIGGLFQADRNKLFAILGIILNGLTLLGVAGLIVLGLAMK